MNILIYDDILHKSGVVEEVINEDTPGHKFAYVSSLQDAKAAIREKKYHMIIADLATPRTRKDKDIERDSGIILLEFIYYSEGETFFRPDEVVVLTEHANDMELINVLKKFPVTVLRYQERGGEWRADLANRIFDCNRKYTRKVDIAIITAVQVEFDAFYHRTAGWEEIEVENDCNLYFATEYDAPKQEKRRVLLTIQPIMGMVPAADITHRVIHNFQPDCIIMSGICAGNKKDVSSGDIIVADKAWDYGSGSIEEIKGAEDTKVIHFMPAPEQIGADKLIIRQFRQYALDDSLKMSIRQQCDMSKFNRDIKILVGGMASGAAIIKNEGFVNQFIKPTYRNYLGIDMETFGVYYTAEQFNDQKIKFVSIKSVADSADSSKSDEFQQYCARLAANLTNYFIKNVPRNILTGDSLTT